MADGRIEYEVRANDEHLESDLEKANGKAEGIMSKVGGVAKGIGVAVGTAFVGATGAAISFGTAFETSMAAASTLFGDANVNTDELNQRMLDLSNTTGIAADELGNSLYNALSAGIPATDDMGEALGFLEKNTKLAKAGFTDIDTAASATAKVLNAYKMDVEDTDKVHKIMLQTQNKGIVTVGELGSVLAQVTPTAAAMGVSFEQVGAGIANMTAQGTPAAQATTQLNSLFAELGKNGTTASNNLKAAAEGTEYAGMSFQDMMAAGVPLNDVLGIMRDYAEQNGLSMLDMFSSIEAGKAALANSGDNANAFTDALAAMTTETDVVGEAFEKVSSTSAERFSKIMNQLQNAAIDLFLQLEPLISEALPLLQDLFDKLIPPVMELVTSLMPLLVDLFEKLIPPTVEIIEALLPILISLFETLVPPLLQIVEMLLPPLLELIDALLPILEILIELLNPILELFIALLEPILSLISGALTPLIGIIKEVLQYAIEPLKMALGILKDTFSSVFNSIATTVNEQINRVRSIFDNLINFVKNVFTGNWKGAWENIKSIFTTIAEGIGAGFKAPINWIIDGINGFLRGLNNISIPDWVPLVGGKGFNIPEIPRLRVGMDYVPSDDFPALLHKGESVLTAEQASVWRSLGGMSGIESLLSIQPIVDSLYKDTITALSAKQAETNIENQTLFGKVADVLEVREEADIDKIANLLFSKIQKASRNKGGGGL